ncbi:MAG: NodT family efflux transporter outer membrane factor (OMF) lipoprotein [Verrucomicrobiales bacterium]|jgi:NodT family efflux transporter outer membrane factor (OMF) lipoprotein
MSRPPISLHQIACLALAVFVTACSPTSRAPGGADGALIGDAKSTNWWREVGGRSLDAQVKEALENSPSIEILAARLEVARADSKLLSASSSPSISATGARQFGERQEFETGGERADVMGYGGSASFGWEVDFWGRVRHLRNGGRKQVEAAFADEEAGRLLIIAEIARLDLARRRLASEEKVVETTLAANTDSVRRLREKQKAGLIGDNLGDRQSAEGDLLQRQIEELRRQRRLAELALDRLLGREPGASTWTKPPVMLRVPELPSVVKTELLANRPDIRAASARVAASWHLSKAATLDLLPKLQFTGLASGRSMRLSPSVDEWIAQIAPTIEVPIWDPLRRAKAEGSDARAKLAAAEYREKVLRAFEEVAVALTNLSAQEKIQRSAEKSAASLRMVYGRTQEKFANGVVSQLEVLEDQRRALAAEREALRAQESRLAAWIDLRKAMGG